LETTRCPASATQVPSLAASMCLPRHACPADSFSFSSLKTKKAGNLSGARPLANPSRDIC
jgi:hypothetical protein